MGQALRMVRQELHPATFAVVQLGLALMWIAFVAISATAFVDVWQPLVIVRSGAFIIEEGVLFIGGSLFLGAGYFASRTLLRLPVPATSDTQSPVMDLAA